MKTTVLAIITVLSAAYSYGQEYKTVRKVVTVLPQQSSYLGRRLHSTIGGEFLANYQVNLPANTIEWVYAFTTSLNAKDSKTLDLAAQLTRQVDPKGTAAIPLDAVTAPSGSAGVDIYLCSRENIDIFMLKSDNSGKRFKYRIPGSRLNATQGVVPVKIDTSNSGAWFLGVKNSGEVDGINVMLEAAAIVEERIPVNKAIAK